MIKKMLLLVIVLLGVWGFEFYRREFSGLGPVPERSSFSGRLPFTVDGNFRRFQFFYSTNRKDSEESFKGRGNVRVDTLVNGTFDALIHPGLNIRPFVWFEDTSMNLDNRTSLHEEEFYKKIKAAVANSTEKSLLVVVWGFRDWFQSAAIKTAYTSYILDIDAPAVLFDWPGNQGEGRNGYLAAREVAVPSAAQLGEWLKNLKEKSGAEKIWIMGSSLGCQVITDALIWLNDHKPGYKLNHVILSAPDVAYESFNNKLKETIPNTTDHLTTFVSSNDRALLMSAWINGKCPTEEALQEIFQEFPLSVFQSIKDEVLKIDHFAFMVSHEINEEELHRILLENGFGDNYRHFPSTIISKELGRVENKEQVPTEIYKATLTNGDRDIEIFIPNASNQQIHHWIESGLGSHIAFKVKSEESITNILICLFENRIPIPDFMMGKPLRNEIEGTVVLYCNVISKGLHFRVEFCHKRS